MSNVYLLRAATVASLTALMLAGAGWIATHEEELPVLEISASSEPVDAGYFPAAFVIEPNEAEPVYFDYY